MAEFLFMDSALTPSNPAILSSQWLASGRTSISDAKINFFFFKSLSLTEGKREKVLFCASLSSRLALMILSLWDKTCDARTWFSDRAQSKEVWESQGEKTINKNTSSELLRSYYLLKLLQSNCSPAEPAVRRFDGAQHPRLDLLGEDHIDLPWCAGSQMAAGLHRCHIARSSNPPSATLHNQKKPKTSMPHAHHSCNSWRPQK